MTERELELLKKKFGEHLRKLRETKKMSLLELSYNCSIDDSKISKIEHGKFNVTLSTLSELAKGLEVPLKKLMDFE